MPTRQVNEAVAALATVVLAEASLDSILQRVVDLARDAIPGADAVSVTLVRDDAAWTAAFAGEVALKLDERQYELRRGPCIQAATGGEVLRVADMATDTRWPGYTPVTVELGVLSSVSLPLPVQEDVIGALNVYAHERDAFDDEAVDVALLFASNAAVAIANVQLHTSSVELASHLEQAMKSRAVIEQAKGVLMAQRRCSPAEAFDVLVRASQRENVKLRDVAQRVVDGVQR